MRVTPEARAAEQRRDSGRRGDFDAVLRRAEARRIDAGRTDAGRAAQRAGARLALTRAAEARAGRAGSSEATASPGPSAKGVARSAGPGEDSPSGGSTLTASAGAAQVTAPAGPGMTERAGEPGRVALAQAVRTLPPIIETFQASSRTALSLDFGGALGVDLRQASGGVELRLSASAVLLPAARAELAGLCRTLAARGVAVVSAEVRGRRPGRGRP
jgi:hypothetical protein